MCGYSNAHSYKNFPASIKQLDSDMNTISYSVILPFARLTMHFPLSSVDSPLANTSLNWGKENPEIYPPPKNSKKMEVATMDKHVLLEKSLPLNLHPVVRLSPIWAETPTPFALLPATGWRKPLPYSSAQQPCLLPACHTGNKPQNKTGLYYTHPIIHFMYLSWMRFGSR